MKAPDTTSSSYTVRLKALSAHRWKRVLDVQAPYRRNLRQVGLGRALDIGCGIGRNLAQLAPGSVGVDHNAHSVAVCRGRGLTAYLPEDFVAAQAANPTSYDGLLLAHVLEHVDEPTADQLLTTYLPFVRPGGVVHLITPQERGFRSDATHLRFLDDGALRLLAGRHGLLPRKSWSFPLPRLLGQVFTYNEFNVTALVPPAR